MAASPEQPSLTVLGGPLSGQRLFFDQTVDGAVIGSDASCSFRIDSPDVSPIHARVRFEDGGLIVFDTQSPRGLYVNDDRVESQAALRNGDILWLGKPGEEGVVMIQCRIPSRPAMTTTPEPPPSGINASSPAVVLDADMVDTVVEPNLEASTGADSFFSDSYANGNASDPNIETRAIPPSERHYESEELPRTLHVDPPPRPPSPSDFEDETSELSAPLPEELPPTMINMAAPELEPPPLEEPPPITLAPPVSVPPSAPRPSAPRPTAAAHPAPRPAASPKPKAPAPSPRPARKSGGGGGAGKIIAAVAALVVVGGGVGGFLFWKSHMAPAGPTHVAPTAATTAPTAAVVAPVGPTVSSATEAPAATAAPPIVEEVVTVVNKTDTPAPRASQQVASATQVQPSAKTPRPAAGGPATAAPPTAPPAGAQAAALKAQAEAAFAAGQYDAAIAHYDEAERLAPSDDLLVGKARAQVARDSMRRRFNTGPTTASGKSAGGSISGFESSDVKVSKALDYSGRLEFEVSPEHVRPGVNYTIKILLTNDGKKKWQVSGVTATTVANGQRAPNTVTSSVRDIDPQQKVTVGEVSGVWPDGVTSWYLEVIVSSGRGDAFKSLLTWK